MEKLFWERYVLLQVIHGVVLTCPGYFWQKHKVNDNEPKQLRKIFAILMALTFYMGKELVLKPVWTVLGEICAFASEL